jgi:AbrB family looped-hinge helix DNA binding protein
MFNSCPRILVDMSEMSVIQDKRKRTYVYMPAFLRDKFNLQNGDRVEVDTDGTRIIITKKTVSKN